MFLKLIPIAKCCFILGLNVGLLSSIPAEATPPVSPAAGKHVVGAEAAAKVLAADKFTYPMKLGYDAAQKHPDVINHLFCYCGCDLTDAHSTLMDCYTSNHGAYCEICLEEAIQAREMRDKHASLSSIQKGIDGHFARLYPYENPSPALQKYRQSLKNDLNESCCTHPEPTKKEKSCCAAGSGSKKLAVCCGHKKH